MPADANTADHSGVAAQACALADEGGQMLHLAVCRRIEVVREHDAVADEHAIGELHAVADEGMAFDLAATADLDAAGDFDERPNERVIADRTTKNIDQLSVKNDDAGS